MYTHQFHYTQTPGLFSVVHSSINKASRNFLIRTAQCQSSLIYPVQKGTIANEFSELARRYIWRLKNAQL